MSEEKFQVVIVGGGLAGLSAGLALAAGGAGEVAVLERGRVSGSKNVIGGILFTPTLERLIPDLLESDAPLERPVTRRTFSVLSGESSADFSFRNGASSRPPHNYSFTVLRGPFDQWLMKRTEAAGVMVVGGVVVEGLIRDSSGKVTGVRTRSEEGTDEEESVLSADLVILAEGANALIAEKEGLKPKMLPQDMAVAVKEVIELPAETISERFNLGEADGEGREYYGEAVKGLFGSGFIYTNRESLSVGVAVSIKDLSGSGLTPNDLLENFKSHPSVSPLLAGGKILEYSAHMIPEGGLRRMSRLFDNGLLVTGDAAGLVNVSPYHEGANLAVYSGLAAAETALEAIAADDFSAGLLSSYERRLEDSFVLKDMSKFADLPGFVKENPALFSAWPTAFLGMLEDIFTISEEPKQALEDRAVERFRREVGLVPFLTALYQWRGATRSLWFESTEKLVEQLGTTGLEMITPLVMKWMEKKKD